MWLSNSNGLTLSSRSPTREESHIFTLDLQLTSWYSGSGRAIEVKPGEEEDEDEAEELQTAEAEFSAASEGGEDEVGSSKGKEREMDVESDEGKWILQSV